MDAYSKLTAIAESSALEVDDEGPTTDMCGFIPGDDAASPDRKSGVASTLIMRRNRHFQEDLPIYNASVSNGRRIPLLKTLLTSACEKNCYYCFSRAGRDCERLTFKPDELAWIYMQIQKAGIARGIFLSSGILGGGRTTQDRLLATAEILRKKYRYQGYIHLKIMPGAEKAQVEHGMKLADRVSINLEAPTSQR